MRSKVKHLRDNGTKDFNGMEHGMLDMHAVASKARIKWQGYVVQAETSYAEHSSGLSRKNSQLQCLVRDWYGADFVYIIEKDSDHVCTFMGFNVNYHYYFCQCKSNKSSRR